LVKVFAMPVFQASDRVRVGLKRAAISAVAEEIKAIQPKYHICPASRSSA
jgi:hypothetical protein